MTDPTEALRRQQVAAINADPKCRDALAARHGEIWDTTELQKDFEPLAFAAPYIIVRRREDGVRGTLMFQNHPRFYFSFEPE